MKSPSCDSIDVTPQAAERESEFPPQAQFRVLKEEVEEVIKTVEEQAEHAKEALQEAFRHHQQSEADELVAVDSSTVRVAATNSRTVDKSMKSVSPDVVDVTHQAAGCESDFSPQAPLRVLEEEAEEAINRVRGQGKHAEEISQEVF